ncbi:hypothetical protein A7982_12225 [Minicystis rosea]|nr:hypothetical protein A7982_12225 [Minicystis rosea]
MTHLLRRITSILAFLAIAALTLVAGCSMQVERGEGTGAAISAEERERAPVFAPGQLERHFEKHGWDMGFTTKEAYLQAAQALVRGGPGVEILHRGGDTLFYKESTNEFAVLSSANVIRTYFQPDGGRRYWERQKWR